MMKASIKILMLLIFIFSSIPNVFAGDVCRIRPGFFQCSGGETAFVDANGVVTISGTTIVGDAKINGTLSATRGIFTTVDVTGSTELVQCTVQSSSRFKGSFLASSTEFQQDVTLLSQQAKFVRSNINGNIHLPASDLKNQVVHLENTSIVKGDIIFDNQRGTVIIKQNSKLHGKVIGGKLRIQPPYNPG